MAGAGIEVKLDGEYQKITEALQKASSPALSQIAHAGGRALKNVSKEAFQKQAGPATGEKWAALGNPEAKEKNAGRILYLGGQLFRSVSMNAFPDGSAIVSSNMVYARIHQEGGKTKAHDIRPRNAKALRFNGICRRLVRHPGPEIPARPCLGAPKDAVNRTAVF
ncbi:MAG: phage virion morphogenesis protein [Spirochaetaceae bacterium]|jgi:phage gpG-like protein|nr:phage virion morphogenesis protein [Spirochaetaceae bacterium]